MRWLWRVWPHHAVPRNTDGGWRACRRCGGQVAVIAGYPTHIWGGTS